MTRIDALEKKIDEHIHDGIGVWTALEGLKTDLIWLKRSFWALTGAILTFGFALLVYAISVHASH